MKVCSYTLSVEYTNCLLIVKYICLHGVNVHIVKKLALKKLECSCT